MELKIGASILAADFSCLDREMQRIEKAGIDFFHVDIMDGHFVPNITIGPAVLKNIRKVSKLPFDVHLMIAQPLKWVEQFIKAGSDMITLHIETISPKEFRSQAKGLKSKGIKLGVSLNPDTPIKKIEQLLELVDFVLVMTVNPGFGGQKFIEQVLPKINALRKIYDGDIAVDGGINGLTSKKVIKAGANILACGTYIFNADNPNEIVRSLKTLEV